MNSNRTNGNQDFDDKEAQKRFEAALKGALITPHKSLKEKPPAAKQPKREKDD